MGDKQWLYEFRQQLDRIWVHFTIEIGRVTDATIINMKLNLVDHATLRSQGELIAILLADGLFGFTLVQLIPLVFDFSR